MDVYLLIILVAIGIGLLLIYLLLHGLIRKAGENEDLKYEFITIIAHKFRTPLTQIKWSTENLLTDETNPYRKQSLLDISSSNENLIKLTGTLVELTDSANSASGSYKFERTNLCELVKNSVDQAKTVFHEKNIFLSVTCSEPLIFASIDRPRIEFVLQTILDNACTYTPPGRNVSVSIISDGNSATIAVTDSGIGIDPKDMGRLFSKFYRSKEAKATDTEGMGIGLYLALSIVKRHHGRVDAISDGIGLGSTFSVTLPVVK